MRYTIVSVAILIVFVFAYGAELQSSYSQLPNSTFELDSLIVIGNGTGTMAFPFNGNYRHTRDGMLYTPAEIGTSGLITSIAFFTTSPLTYTGGVIEIWMKETTQSNLSTATSWDSLITGATRVDSATITGATTGWNTFTFPSPFAYSGQSNLLIAARSYVTTVNGTNSGWQRTAVTPNMCVANATNTNPWPDTALVSRPNRPNLQLNITPTLAPPSNPVPANNATNIGTNFTMSWRVMNINGVDVYLDTINPPTHRVIENQNVSSFTPRPFLLPNRMYYWKVFAYNDSDSVSSSVWRFTTAAGPIDITPPVIHHTPMTFTDSTTSISVNAIIHDDFVIANGANSPRLYHKLSTTTTWSFTIPDSIVQDSVFYFTIPSYPHSSTVNYYFAAQDTAGNVSTLPAGGTGSNPPGTTPPSSTYNYYIRQSLSGVKTIGSNNADFTSITVALASVNTNGIGIGGVIFSIQAGSYIDSSTDISVTTDASRPVRFVPDSGATVSLHKTGYTNHTAAFRFTHCQYVTIDGSWRGDAVGRHITIDGNGLSQAIWFGDTSANNAVMYCILNVGSTASTAKAVQFGTGTIPDQTIQGNTISNCDVLSGYYGVMLIGGANQPLSNCTIDQCNIRNFAYIGIYSNYSNNMFVSRNRIWQDQAVVTSTIYGIYLITNSDNGRITGNKIGPLSSSNANASFYGIQTYGTNNLISNNMISLGTGNQVNVYGIYTPSAALGESLKLLYNSIWISGIYTGGGAVSSLASAAYYSAATTTGDSVWGNIFLNTRTGGNATNYHVAIAANAAGLLFSNYNLISVGNDSLTDNRYVGRINQTANYNSFNDLLAGLWGGKDGLSYGECAPFDSIGDLHINHAVRTSIESGSPRHPLVQYDIDGNLRNLQADIGADEGDFMPIALGSIRGTARDSTTGLPPLSGVIVRAGQYIDTTDINGRYSLSVRSGTYQLVVSKECFAADSVLTTIADSSSIDTVNFTMLHPEMTTDESRIDFVSRIGEMHSSTMVFRNPGNADLHWSGLAVPDPSEFDKWSGNNKQSPVTIRVSNKVGPTSKHIVHRTLDAPASTFEVDQTWGPDGYGYRAMDNLEFTWPTYVQFRELRGIGTLVTSGYNTGGSVIMDGSSFRYYGQTYNSIYVNSCGYVQFTANGTASAANYPLPATVLPNSVFVFHDALITSVYKYCDTTLNVFYLQWVGSEYSHPSDTVNFELQLWGRQNAMVFAYSYVVGNHASATIGIQDDVGANNRFLQCYYNLTAPFPALLNGYAISFNDMSTGSSGGWTNWLSMSPITGTVMPQQLAEVFVQIAIDSSATVPSVWNGRIVLTSDACPTIRTIPVTVSIVESTPEETTIPQDYKLYQNYPNPFNPITEIRFDLKLTGLTKIGVYDVLGRQVEELVHQVLPAGYHSVQFNATKLSSGTYFYQIESGKFIEMKKMVLVK